MTASASATGTGQCRIASKESQATSLKVARAQRALSIATQTARTGTEESNGAVNRAGFSCGMKSARSHSPSASCAQGRPAGPVFIFSGSTLLTPPPHHCLSIEVSSVSVGEARGLVALSLQVDTHGAGCDTGTYSSRPGCPGSRLRYLSSRPGCWLECPES